MTPASQPSGAPAAEPSASNPFASSPAAKHRAAWAFGLLGATGLVVALNLAVKNAPLGSSTATPPAAVAAAPTAGTPLPLASSDAAAAHAAPAPAVSALPNDSEVELDRTKKPKAPTSCAASRRDHYGGAR